MKRRRSELTCRVEDPSQLVFFLGGRDLEMATIRDLLDLHAPGRVYDRKLGWGARASSYRDEIRAAITEEKRVVLVELEVDFEIGDDSLILVVDHHGDSSGAEAPTSLHQVFRLLGLPDSDWTRDYELVAANDRGHIQALRQCGASLQEIRDVRNRDRREQGVTAREEMEAKAACAQAELRCQGSLTIVRCPHARTAPVSDFLDPAFGGPGYENLLIISPPEVNFYGSGRCVQFLDAVFPGGWRGGELPVRGFWGRPVSGEESEVILEELTRHLSKTVERT